MAVRITKQEILNELEDIIYNANDNKRDTIGKLQDLAKAIRSDINNDKKGVK